MENQILCISSQSRNSNKDQNDYSMSSIIKQPFYRGSLYNEIESHEIIAFNNNGSILNSVHLSSGNQENPNVADLENSKQENESD